MRQITYSETLTVTSCWCGIALAVPDNLYRYTKQSSSRHIFCPLGHQFVFGDTFEKQLRETERRLKATKDLLVAEERSHVATRGHLTRARKRAAAGVCPCCHRTFQNVTRHVASKHPDFDPAALPT